MKKKNFDKNYLGHNFVKYVGEVAGEFSYDCICSKCKIRIVYNQEYEAKQYILCDDVGVYLECLSCSEHIIKNIIE